MGVLSSFRQLDGGSVKLWNDLPEDQMEKMEELGLEIAEVSGMRDKAYFLDVYCLG
ncbi:unnamed protein product [Prunus armeniaca]